MDKELLVYYLEQGLTNRQIAEKVGKAKSTVNYWIHKLDIVEKQEKHKLPPYSFGKIDTKEKAYALGFLAADGNINNSMVNINIALEDKEVLNFIAPIINARTFEDHTINKKQKKFPQIRLSKKIEDIHKFVGSSTLKEGRNLPIVPKDLRRFLLLGFFDGDGSISWGVRADRNRIWHKISFTSSLSLLTAVQQILIKDIGISSVIKPKTGENCFVLEFANKKDVLLFLNYIYPNNDFIILQRKYLKYKALRLKLGEFGETCDGNTEPSLLSRKV